MTSSEDVRRPRRTLTTLTAISVSGRLFFAKMEQYIQDATWRTSPTALQSAPRGPPWSRPCLKVTGSSRP
ncbi:hypothetical protein MAR_004739 [Mya arenaria]|uniref:Uncharacterized protein n=1 Tax=Mya arenaria TaxID=6604 RepID=A0ABY7F086_MYAAR|nr:hypothetical protein MAR_004739 [Mya arenaria]